MFITRLALQLPDLNRLGIYGASWTTSSVRVDDIQYLQVFHSITSLHLYKVTFTNASQSARLLAALPALIVLIFADVLCTQGHNVSPTALHFQRGTLLCGRLHLFDPLAPPVLNLLTHLSVQAGLYSLRLKLNLCSPLTGAETCEKLRMLRVTASSVRVLTLEMDALEAVSSELDSIGEFLRGTPEFANAVLLR